MMGRYEQLALMMALTVSLIATYVVSAGDHISAADTHSNPGLESELQAELIDLVELADLRTQFNDDPDLPRLFLIVSPT